MASLDFSKSRNAGKIKRIQEKSAEQTNGLITLNIPLDQIDENPDNASIFNMDNIDTLAEGIKKDGFMGAINVFQKPDGRYEISSGHRRYRAMKLLGRPTIPCNVSPYPDDVERGLKLISSNIRNRVLRPLDWARAIDYYENIMKIKGEYEGRLRDRAAEYFKMAPTNIHRYTSLLKLIPELQELANDPEYAYSAFTTAATLSQDEQKELYRSIIRENSELDKKEESLKVLSRARIEQLINNIKHKDDNMAGQQNKVDGNFNTSAINNGKNDEDSLYKTQNHLESFNEDDSGFEKGRSDINSGLKDFNDDSSMNIDVTEDESSESYGDGPVFEDFDDDTFNSGDGAEQNKGVLLDAKLSQIASEIEVLSRVEFRVSDDSLVQEFISRIRTAVENIEKSI